MSNLKSTEQALKSATEHAERELKPSDLEAQLAAPGGRAELACEATPAPQPCADKEKEMEEQEQACQHDEAAASTTGLASEPQKQRKPKA